MDLLKKIEDINNIKDSSIFKEKSITLNYNTKKIHIGNPFGEFSIDGNTFTFIKGMTWGEFISNRTDNVFTLSNDGCQYVLYNNKQLNALGTTIEGIIEEKEYTLRTGVEKPCTSTNPN